MSAVAATGLHGEVIASGPTPSDTATHPQGLAVEAMQVSAQGSSVFDDWLGPGHWRLAVSPFAHHFRHNPNHRHVWALGLERQGSDDWMVGASYFRNSFGQPSSYTYIGKRYPALGGVPRLFGQLSAGVLYGYRGEWKNKVPLNYKGFSPGALVTVGWQFDKTQSVSAHLLGDAGVMIQFAFDLD